MSTFIFTIGAEVRGAEECSALAAAADGTLDPAWACDARPWVSASALGVGAMCVFAFIHLRGSTCRSPLRMISGIVAIVASVLPYAWLRATGIL